MGGTEEILSETLKEFNTLVYENATLKAQLAETRKEVDAYSAARVEACKDVLKNLRAVRDNTIAEFSNPESPLIESELEVMLYVIKETILSLAFALDVEP